MRKIPFLFFIVVFGCRPCSNPPDRRLDNTTIMDFGSAKNSSWWTYKNEQTDETDSIYLTNYSHRIENFRGKEECDDVELITYNLNGNGKLCSVSKITIDARTSIDLINSNDTVGQLMNYTVYKAKGGFYERSKWHDYEVLPTYQLGNLTFSNVIKIYYKNYTTDGTGNTEPKQVRYFAPKVGLIKFQNIPDINNKDSSSFILTNYKIVE